LPRAEMAWIPLIAILVALATYVFVLPGVLAAWVGLTLGSRFLISGALLMPLGFAMGMPFPTGLRALAGEAVARSRPGQQATDNAIEWAWAINAAASVLGSVLAMVIAIQFGLTVTLTCGALAYLLAVVLMPTLRVKAA